MQKNNITRATLGRLPMYLEYIKANVTAETTSATEIAGSLGIGEVTVRRDLNLVCGQGRPKVGYPVKALVAALESVLGKNKLIPVVVVGAGKLGRALQNYDGFKKYGLEIVAAFDNDDEKTGVQSKNKPVYLMKQLSGFCKRNDVHIGIITVPTQTAQNVCDKMIKCGITAIWNFAPCPLTVPEGVAVRNENLALSLAHLNMVASGK